MPFDWTATSRVGGGLLVVAAVASLLFSPVTWLTGGLRPQSSIAVEDLQKANALILARLDALAATEAADKAQQIAATDTLRQLVAARLDALWRPSDLADRDAHLSRLDTVFDALREKTTDNAYAIKDLTNKYQSLTTAPVRR